MESAQRLEDRMRKDQKDQGDLEKTVVTGRSKDGTVIAIATGLGRLQAVRLDPRIYQQRDLGSLQNAIVEAVRAAAESVTALVAEKRGPGEINLH